MLNSEKKKKLEETFVHMAAKIQTHFALIWPGMLGIFWKRLDLDWNSNRSLSKAWLHTICLNDGPPVDLREWMRLNPSNAFNSSLLQTK